MNYQEKQKLIKDILTNSIYDNGSIEYRRLHTSFEKIFSEDLENLKKIIDEKSLRTLDSK